MAFDAQKPVRKPRCKFKKDGRVRWGKGLQVYRVTEVVYCGVSNDWMIYARFGVLRVVDRQGAFTNAEV